MRKTLIILFAVSAFVTNGQELATKLDAEIDKIYTTVDEPAEYPGGIFKMVDYIMKELNYPEEAIQNNISGRVFVKYVIEKDGSISNLKIVKGIGFGCDQEAMKVFENMPKWTPAKLDGKPVRQVTISPVFFKPKSASGN